MSDEPNPPPKDKPPSTTQRLAWAEQCAKDAADRLGEMVQLYTELRDSIQRLAARLEQAETKLRRLIPEVENCPRCHRKVNPGARKCGVCGHVW